MDNSIAEKVVNKQKDQDRNLFKTTNIAKNGGIAQQTEINDSYTLTNHSKDKKPETNYISAKLANTNQQTKVNYLCFLSSNSKNKILQFTRFIIDHTDICHYVTPGASIS